MGYHNPHRTFGSKVHWRLQSRLAFHYSRLSGLHRSSYQLPWKASCASRTKSITSSVALTLKRSQYQSTHISAGNIVSNMKSWSSWRVLVICVLFMMVYLHRFERIASGCVTPRRLSHAVEHLRDCLLILFVGSEAITEPSGNLTDRTVDGIASLLDHLQAVGVLCFVHTCMMAYPAGFGSSRWYKTTKENLKVACANLATGQAAAILNYQSTWEWEINPLSITNSKTHSWHLTPKLIVDR